MPTKNASRDLNSADNPRNETTRLSALATGFRLRTTAPPKITVSTAKTQNRKGDIFQATDEHGSNTDVNRNPKIRIIRDYPWLLFFFVPFEYHAVHYSADLEKFFLVMHHVGACEAGDGIIFAQKNLLLRTNFLTHPAVNAADHVDIEFLREFFDLGEPVGRSNFASNNFDRARRTNEFAKLTRDTAYPSIRVAHQCGCAAVI